MKRATSLLELQLAIVTGMLVAVIAGQLVLRQWLRFQTIREHIALGQTKELLGSNLQYLIWNTPKNELLLTPNLLGSPKNQWQLTGKGFYLYDRPFQPFGFHCRLENVQQAGARLTVRVSLHSDHLHETAEWVYWRRPFY